jgi:UDP-3-O-[3-hydroxymyristoyl] N-acetylglucosamine deacetylase
MKADPTDELTPWAQPWTLAAPITMEGVGLHSGRPALVRLVPAPAGHGLVFHRVDLPGSPAIPARAELVTETLLSTTLAVEDAPMAPQGALGFGTLAGSFTRVQTVEHLLAALWGMGVSDARIEVDGPEVPVLDGSARPYVEAILKTGVTVLEGTRLVLPLPQAGRVDGEKAISVVPDTACRITCVVDYGHPLAGPQIFQITLTPATFASEIAGARTFGFLRDVEAMRAHGLAKGGSVENAVVIGEDTYSSPLRFADELVRHKALDLIGDFALLGAHWTGHVLVVKGGHKLHNELARDLVGQLRPPFGAVANKR